MFVNGGRSAGSTGAVVMRQSYHGTRRAVRFLSRERPASRAALGSRKMGGRMPVFRLSAPRWLDRAQQLAATLDRARLDAIRSPPR
jgi:hypothetical protein